MVERRRLIRLTLAATIAAGSARAALWDSAQAQEDGAGQLTGLVRGADSEPLVGAIVTVTSPELDGGDTTLTTDDSGRYTLGPIRPGLYDVAVELQGYRRGSLTTLKIENGQTTQADLTLERRTGGEDGY